MPRAHHAALLLACTIVTSGADRHGAPAAAGGVAEACALDRTDFTLNGSNAWFPIVAGSQWTYRHAEDELRVTILSDTEVVAGVTTRVLEERESEDGKLVEVSRNYVVATREGTICYLGESVDNYSGGRVSSHDGSWRADGMGNRGGVLMPADPRPGMHFQMEGAPGVAEDTGVVVASGRVKVPAGTFERTIRVDEHDRRAHEMDVKLFAHGVGLLKDEDLELVQYRLGP